MLVASATSTGSPPERTFDVGGCPQPNVSCALAAHLVGRDARGELDRLAPAAVGEGLVGRLEAAARGAIARDARGNLVLDDAPRAAELAQRVEIAERGQVGVGRSSSFGRAAPAAPASSVSSARRKTSFGPRPGAASPT